MTRARPKHVLIALAAYIAFVLALYGPGWGKQWGWW